MNKIGASFSTPHLEHLGLNVADALTATLQLNFATLRFGAYWNRIEKSPNNYDFSALHFLIAECEKNQQSVIVTVGAKAPRWPEFHYPDHLEEKNLQSERTQQQLLNFVTATITELKNYQCITHWQIENEPLDPSGPDQQTVPLAFLAQEINLIRQLDSRPNIGTLWGNDLSTRNLIPSLANLVDIIGIDLYYKQFSTELFGKPFYRGPADSPKALTKIIAESPKPIWITELQAEPWEKNDTAYQSKNPASMNPEQLKKNLATALQLPVDVILWWGLEYWLWQAHIGNSDYLSTARHFLKDGG